MQPSLAKFYKENIQISQEKAMQIAQVTKEQAGSKDWFRERKVRVTASRAKRILSARKPETRHKYFFDGPPPDIPSLCYGKEQEPLARAKYEAVSRNFVTQIGLVVSTNHCWLAGSPDGIVYKEDRQKILVELKCPFSNKDSDIDVKYIKDNKLNKNHEYYMQVQILMHICKITLCHFFVYTSKDYKLLTVPYDHTFC